jgi:hypothetical protein
VFDLTEEALDEIALLIKEGAEDDWVHPISLRWDIGPAAALGMPCSSHAMFSRTM